MGACSGGLVAFLQTATPLGRCRRRREFAGALVGRCPQMRLSLTKLAAGLGGVGVGVSLALTAGAATASADPLDPVVNTTCSYGQVMAALNATDPGAAAQLNSSPIAQGYLRNFLASPPSKRLQMAQQIQAMPQAAPYFNDVLSVAGSCNNY